MRDCSISREEKENLDILRLDGSLDSFSFPKLEQALGELRDQDRHCVVLDCKGLDYICKRQWFGHTLRHCCVACNGIDDS